MIRHLDLFAGIGGFSKAVEWLGGETVAFVEWESWNRRVLAKHWPGAQFYGDIRAVTDDDLRSLGHIDLITGGYPCQPFSLAGQRRGAEDDRHLWPEMRRVINAIRPRFVLAENVNGHITMGLDTVLTDLEADGYTCRATPIPASAVNALHQRKRVWIMAYSDAITELPQGVINRPVIHRGNARMDDQRGGSRQPEQPTEPGVADTEQRPGELRHESPKVGGRSDEAEQAGMGRRGTTTGLIWHKGGWKRRCDVPESEHPERQRGTWGRIEDASGTRIIAPTGEQVEASRTLDAGVDGVSARSLRRSATRSPEPDRIRQAWANGSWESDLPRVVTDEPDRRQKLMAAGNAIVPVVAYEILRVMLTEEGTA